MNRYDKPIDEEIEQAKEYYDFLEKEHEKPKLVFKYKSVSTATDVVRLCNILQDKKIYMPTIEKLNDPLETKNSLLWGISEEKRTTYFQNCRVLALSSNPLLPTLWAYYADNYKGICLGFWTNNNFSSIEQVQYCKKQENIVWELDANDSLKKAQAWAHENEWRIVGWQKSHLEFDERDLACVIFGCRIEEEIKEYIEKFIPKNVLIFTVKPDSSKFCLYAEIDDYRAIDSDELEKIIKLKSN